MGAQFDDVEVAVGDFHSRKRNRTRNLCLDCIRTFSKTRFGCTHTKTYPHDRDCKVYDTKMVVIIHLWFRGVLYSRCQNFLGRSQKLNFETSLRRGCGWVSDIIYANMSTWLRVHVGNFGFLGDPRKIFASTVKYPSEPQVYDTPPTLTPRI